MVEREIEQSNNNEQLLSLDDILEILGNSTRRIILAKLAKVPHSTSELAASLGISRQAVHSQLKQLAKQGIIEEIETEDKSSIKYRIKSNLSIRIDISPDYFNISYEIFEDDSNIEVLNIEQMSECTDYQKLKDPNEQIRYLGRKIRETEQ
ncbi:MAG: ArsR/SmtB family transcription factor, partial [Promethearchaeota archaeon]